MRTKRNLRPGWLGEVTSPIMCYQTTHTGLLSKTVIAKSGEFVLYLSVDHIIPNFHRVLTMTGVWLVKDWVLRDCVGDVST